MSYGQDAEETKEWDRFWGSGRVEDYLRYKNCCQEEKEESDATRRGGTGRKFVEDRDRFS